jgi:hypothetical protein
VDRRAIEQDRDVMPDWLWRQEYLAEFTVPGGQVFPNVVVGPFTLPARIEAMERSVGVDFNGTPGDVAVEVCRMHDTKDVFVLGEDVFTHPETGLDMSWLRQYKGQKRVEAGGYNEGFALEAINYGATPCENTQQARSARLTAALSFRVHLDPQLAPQLYEDVRTAQWDPRGIIAYLKDDAHGMHYADAFLLALPGIAGQAVWAPKHKHAGSLSATRRDRERDAQVLWRKT